MIRICSNEFIFKKPSESNFFFTPDTTYQRETHPSSSAWIEPKEAFHLLSLTWGETTSHRIWQYFVSPLVTFIIQRPDGSHWRSQTPHAVEPGGRLRPLVDGEWATFPCKVSRPDVERLTRGLPYLYDSLALTAWRIGRREIFRLPLDARGCGGQLSDTLKHARLVLWLRFRDCPDSAVGWHQRVGATLAESLALLLTADLEADVLCAPWIVDPENADPTVVSPPFWVKNRNVLLPRYRDPWWIGEVTERCKEHRHAQSTPQDHARPLDPVTQIPRFFPVTSSLILTPAEFLPAQAQGATKTEIQGHNAKIFWVYAKTETRIQDYFLTGKVVRVPLKRTACVYCGSTLQAARRQGRPLMHCNSGDCQTAHAVKAQWKEKIEERNWKRRNTWAGSNKRRPGRPAKKCVGKIT